MKQTQPDGNDSKRMVSLGLLAMGLLGLTAGCQTHAWPESELKVSGRQTHKAHRVQTPPVIDGKLDEQAWKDAPRTNPFVSIVGPEKGSPDHAAHGKILWDDTHVYFAAEIEEPHLWGTLTERDSVIFRNNAFEVFLDPDRDRQNYYELEINSLGTLWDLLMDKPYSDEGSPDNGFDTPGLALAVHLNGTLNDPSDVDQGWTVEVAIPFTAMEKMRGTTAPPAIGEVWWANLSRVQWRLDVTENNQAYTKRKAPDGTELPEQYWVWSPIGERNMHKPERWGLVMFVE